MKPHSLLALAAMAALLAGGCKTADDYTRNNAATANWLHAHAGTPMANVAGDWDSPDWGEGHFKQSGNRVTGILGDYPIGGVMSGRTLFLAITEDGWTYYTAILQAGPGDRTLDGTYSHDIPFSPDDQNSMSLTRAAR